MLVKKGVNTTREEKSGPTVKEGIASTSRNKFKRIVTCSHCKTKLEKCCDNEMVCEISILKCPRCGANVS
jgi:hypothetical protein